MRVNVVLIIGSIVEKSPRLWGDFDLLQELYADFFISNEGSLAAGQEVMCSKIPDLYASRALIVLDQSSTLGQNSTPNQPLTAFWIGCITTPKIECLPVFLSIRSASSRVVIENTTSLLVVISFVEDVWSLFSGIEKYNTGIVSYFWRNARKCYFFAARTAISISFMISGFALRKVRELSRPCPRRVSPYE